MPHRWVNATEGAEIANVIEHEAGLRSLRDAARILAVHPGVMRAALESGLLPDAFQTSAGHWRVPLADIVALRAGGPEVFAAVDRCSRDEPPEQRPVGSHQQAGRAPQTLAAERRAHIIALLDERRAVRVSSLSALLGVSQMTIRRDLDHLDLEGLATRAHGGAIARQ